MQKAHVYNYISDGTPVDIQERYALLSQIAQKSDFGILDENVVVLDTETTGFSFNHDELTQIAAARMVHGEIKEWFVTFVNPGKPIPDDVARLTNIHDEDVADAPTPLEAIESLVTFVGDSIVVAHNAAFDKHFTAEKHAAGNPLKENWWIDSLDLARIALPRLKSHRLIDLVHAFDAPISTHRADADVEALCAVYRILLAAVSEMPTELVHQIANLATYEEWPTGKVFAEIGVYQDQQQEIKRTAGTDVKKRYPFSLRAMRSGRFRRKESDSSMHVLQRSDKNSSTLLGGAQSTETTLEHIPNRAAIFPTEEEIKQAFSSTGLVGSLYEDFEPRDEQIIMAREVRKAQSLNTNLVVEAGTGVGKSMAYLVPSALTAVKNDITVGIATKTNALLDQIMYKELPLLDKALRMQGEEGLRYAALKGFSHYPCLYRINRILNDGVHARVVAGKQLHQAPSLAAMLSFIEQTEYDDIDNLKLDYRVLPRYSITSTSRDCLRRKCPFYGTSCFVHGQRKKAENAHVLVTNHALLFCDVAADGGLLPHIKNWVIDEAHGAESEARRALAVSLDAAEILRLCSRLESQEAKKNAFVRCERQAVFTGETEESKTLFYALIGKAQQYGRSCALAGQEFAHHIKDLVACDSTPGNKSYETIELWINSDVRNHTIFQALSGYAASFKASAEKLLTSASELVAYLEDVEGLVDNQREIATIVIDIKDMLSSMETIFEQADERYVYSATLSRRPEHVAEVLHAQLVDVGSMLDDTLYQDTDSVVFASATITIGDNFDTFHNALGLGISEASSVRDCMLGSSYDFDTNMQVLVIDDIPEPNQAQYLPVLQQLLVRAHIAQKGSMLTLFTNRREMESCFDVVDPIMKRHDLRLVCQKWGVSTKGLRDDFLKDEHLSLFALKSFWEGFDAPGATLKGVVIPKLPFAKPSDPLSCERAQRDKSAWSHYILPAAVIEVKQAAGRLIRSSTDTGVLILADKRLTSKGYGRVFLQSLPSKNVKICSIDEAIAVLMGDV